jgi:hypothetical protein
VCEVYQTAKKALESLPDLETSATAATSDTDTGTGESQAKKRRSTSSASAAAMDVFREVMLASSGGSSSPPRAPPKTPTEFMRRCNMNDEQVKAVYVLCETDAPDMDMLAALQDDDLETLGLKKVQAQTWKRLAAKL